MARYVEDLFILSYWFCKGCVGELIPSIYRGVVGFDTCNDGNACVQGFNIVKFLDLWIYVIWVDTLIFLVDKNDLFVFFGIASSNTKTVFRPR